MPVLVELVAEVAGAGGTDDAVSVREKSELAPLNAILTLAPAAAAAMVHVAVAVFKGRGRCGTEKSTRPINNVVILAETTVAATRISRGRGSLSTGTKRTPQHFSFGNDCCRRFRFWWTQRPAPDNNSLVKGGAEPRVDEGNTMRVYKQHCGW